MIRTLFLIFLVASTVASATVIDLSSHSSEEFDRVVGAPDASYIVKFFAPWCGHCRALEPAWEELSAKYPYVARVDCTQNAALCQRFGVSGYPTLKHFPHGANDPVPYQGPRSVDSFLAFLPKLSPKKAPNSVSKLRRLLKQALASDDKCEISLVASINGLHLSCPLDVSDVVKSAIAGSSQKHRLVQLMEDLSALPGVRAALNMEEVMNGLLIVELPDVNIKTLL